MTIKITCEILRYRENFLLCAFCCLAFDSSQLPVPGGMWKSQLRKPSRPPLLVDAIGKNSWVYDIHLGLTQQSSIAPKMATKSLFPLADHKFHQTSPPSGILCYIPTPDAPWPCFLGPLCDFSKQLWNMAVLGPSRFVISRQQKWGEHIWLVVQFHNFEKYEFVKFVHGVGMTSHIWNGK